MTTLLSFCLLIVEEPSYSLSISLISTFSATYKNFVRESVAQRLAFQKELEGARAKLAIATRDIKQSGTSDTGLAELTKKEAFVGRLRIDNTMPNTLNMWIVADNLRKGAATNAIQIAEYLVEKELVGVS